MDWKIASIREGDLEAEAAALYSTSLPYHNFQHVLATLEAAERIITHCVDEGIRVDAKVVYYALLFHDAGYHEDHRRLGHSSKESYSAELAQACLTRRKALTIVVKKVVAAILSTQRDARFITTEQKVVRAADLSGLAADYAIFHRNTERLKQEYELLTERPLTWLEWTYRAGDAIQYYLGQEIRLTSYYADANGESAFHAAVRANLIRLQQEVTEG